MACRERAQEETTLVATQGSDSSASFTAIGEIIPLDGIGAVATAMNVVSLTTNFRGRAAFRTSDDGLTWSTPVGLGSYQSSEGWSYVDFTSLGDVSGRYLQIGVQALNDTSTSEIERAVLTLRASFRGVPAQDHEVSDYDLVNDYEGEIANGFTASIVEQASGFFRVQLTGQSAIDDGIAEMFVRTFSVRDASGAVVDLSTGSYGVVWQISVDDSNFPEGDSFLFHFGPVQVSGADLASPGTVEVASFMGFTSGSGTGNRGNSRSTGGTNATTKSNGVRRMRGIWTPHIDVGGTPELGAHVVQWLDNSEGALLSLQNDNSNNPDFTKAWGMALALGFDASHANTQSADIRVGARAFKLPTI